MKNRVTRFLITSLVLLSVLCLGIFSFMLTYMDQKNQETHSEIGTKYMSGMSERILMHFETTCVDRLSQVEALVETISQEGFSSIEELKKELIYNAKARGFEHLAFYSSNGEFEMLYGEMMEVVDPEPFQRSLCDGQKKIAVGRAVSGEDLVLLSVSSDYPMEDGKKNVALVAALPVSYIREIMSLDEEDALTYSHIIRRDGSYVIRSEEVFDSYFDRVRSDCGDQAEGYIEELKKSMEAHEDVGMILETAEGRRNIHCNILPYSEWYLITVMPYGLLDEAIESLGKQWISMAVISCLIILGALTMIFTAYFRITKRQIRELTEAQREALRANKAKSEFLSNMSHDIRTPMNAIVGMTAIATANIDDQKQVQNCLRKIGLSSKHLLGLINDVLDMSKIESGKMTLNMDRVSLREVMESIVSIVQSEVKMRRQTFDVSIHDVIEENVYCDSVRLNQVLLNFLSNAVKFTPEGGKIRVSLYEEESPKGEEFVRVHIYVKDSGIGMTPEFQKKIFDSFTREDSTRVRKTEGTGLGMTITKYIVDAMGGEILVDSELGNGTEFHVILDLERAEEEEEDMILPNWNMLLVDDDRLLCETTAASLKSIGVNAEWTLDGENAIQMVEKHHRMKDDYHIILLDWKLPNISGIQVARQIRERMGKDVPILLISAYDWSEIEDEAKEAGINGFISKPLFKSTLFYGLRQYVGQEEEILETSKAKEPDTDFSGRHILVAEDNELNWEIASALLSELGFTLDWAENGQVCADKFARSAPGFYDAVLMDLRMPVMNGYEATAAIRGMDRVDADIPIIAMTADAFSEDIKKCLDAGMNAHVSKPIDIREIARLLERYMKH
ncbi:MAG: response regulator [Lachnospiraceae bacterium]|nr:response regulator [Lachnospiraceae bacterium]